MTSSTATIPGAARSRPGGPTDAATVTCAGCGTVASVTDAFPARCRAAAPCDDIDHVMVRRLDLQSVSLVAGDDPNPFVRYRQLFRAWHLAIAGGWSDERYVGVVRRLDDAVAAVDGRGFRVTPFARSDALSAELGFAASGGVWVKDEAGGVAGSHKARHLMGLMIELLVAEVPDPSLADRPLAIASCGNAALAAAVVARAAGRTLDVFVPPDADAAVVDQLGRLRARVETVHRAPGETGDPTLRRLRAAVAAGAIPFTCQGPENGLAIEGGQTIGYEIAEAVAAGAIGPDRLVVQVGGGALATACAEGLREAVALGVMARLPRIDTVQTAGGWPLRRAYERICDDLREVGADPCRPLPRSSPQVTAALDRAARHRSRYMWPWDPAPRSVAHGIVDDETYDWLAVVRAMLVTGGHALVVDEPTLNCANEMAIRTTGIAADETGTAGLAGVVELHRRHEIRPEERVAVLLTGARRDSSVRHASPDNPPDRRTP